MEFCQTLKTPHPLRKHVERLYLIGLMVVVVMLMVFFRCSELVLVYVLWGVNPILKNGSYSKEWVWNLGTKLCYTVPGSDMSAGLHSRNLIFDTKSCRIESPLLDW